MRIAYVRTYTYVEEWPFSFVIKKRNQNPPTPPYPPRRPLSPISRKDASVVGHDNDNDDNDNDDRNNDDHNNDEHDNYDYDHDVMTTITAVATIARAKAQPRRRIDAALVSLDIYLSYDSKDIRISFVLAAFYFFFFLFRPAVSHPNASHPSHI